MQDTNSGSVGPHPTKLPPFLTRLKHAKSPLEFPSLKVAPTFTLTYDLHLQTIIFKKPPAAAEEPHRVVNKLLSSYAKQLEIILPFENETPLRLSFAFVCTRNVKTEYILKLKLPSLKVSPPHFYRHTSESGNAMASVRPSVRSSTRQTVSTINF